MSLLLLVSSISLLISSAFLVNFPKQDVLRRDNLYRVFSSTRKSSFGSTDRFNPSRSSKGPFKNPSKYNPDEDNNIGKSSRPTGKPDGWKILMKKVETTKPDSRFAKNGDNKYNNSTSSSSGRDDLKCIHFDTCSGCTMKADFLESPIMRKARNYFQSEQIPFNIHIQDQKNITGWRTHVKLAVQPMSKWGGLKFGLFKAQSHEVSAIPDCQVHHPVINIASEIIRLAALDLGVKGYVPPTQTRASTGDLRYVQLTVERLTNKVQVVLVWNKLDYKNCDVTLPRLVKKLKSEYPALFHSITVNFHVSASNNIFNYDTKSWKTLWGLPYLKEKIGQVNFYFRPQIFRQANLDYFESAILPKVIQYIPSGSKVSELYAGIGIIGLNLAASGKAEEVLCSDSNSYVDEVFDKCVHTMPNDQEQQERVFFECLDAEAAVNAGQCQDCDILVVDPPRKGLNTGVRDYLLNKPSESSRLGSSRPGGGGQAADMMMMMQLADAEETRPPLSKQLKRVIYISCGFDSLQEDCRMLLASGLWKIKAAEGFALFPGTDHIETMVVLDRV